MTEQNKDATSYIDAAISACRRHLALVDDAEDRGIHSQEEACQLREAIIAQTEDAWDVDLTDLRNSLEPHTTTMGDI